MNFSKAKVFVCPPLIGKGILSVTNILFVKTGIAFSSPSVYLPAPATILQVIAPKPSGILSSQLKAALFDFTALKVVTAGFLPNNVELISFIVVASYKNNCAVPLISASERLSTFAVRIILSFSLKKRGKLGVTINCFCVTSSLVVIPYFKSLV